MSGQRLVLVGIDEAGYGPLLGPLCVGMAAFAVTLPAGDGASAPTVPDLWSLLGRGVCRKPGRGGKPDAQGRIAIADSKQLKLSSSVTTTHPLVHLERGVLAMLLARATGADAETPTLAGDDDALLARLGARWPAQAWYAGPAQRLPMAQDAGLLAIAGSGLRRCLHEAGVELLDLRCRVMGEAEFNAIALGTPGSEEQGGGKAATTLHAAGELLRHAWERWGARTGERASLGIVCDRQGGRAQYAGWLASALPDARATIIEESPARSRYVLESADAHATTPRRAGVSFLVEGEQHHLPVALASMTAKLVRELAMGRFNAYWSHASRQRAGVELKPTAGYGTDAQRWLTDTRPFVSSDERHALLRQR